MKVNSNFEKQTASIFRDEQEAKQEIRMSQAYRKEVDCFSLQILKMGTIYSS
jgi:hypothetical protein